MFRYMVFYKEESGHDFTFVEAENLTKAVEEACEVLSSSAVIIDIGRVGTTV